MLLNRADQCIIRHQALPFGECAASGIPDTIACLKKNKLGEYLKKVMIIQTLLYQGQVFCYLILVLPRTKCKDPEMGILRTQYKTVLSPKVFFFFLLF